MTNSSDASDQAIPLPQGGGAMRGIGETFSPDLFTGTGNFNVPLSIPAGRNNFQPDLALVYSSGNGNGPYGLGWNLSIPGISRKTDKGIPRYDESDTFVLSGAEDLVPVGGNELDGRRYRPRTEGLFAEILHLRDGGNDYWRVKTKDGLIHLYGTPCPAAAPADWRDPAVIADADNPRRIYTWQLTSSVDPFGNRIEYRYTTSPVEDPARRPNQLYLAEIRYLDYGPASEPSFLVRVAFAYSQRPDPFSHYRSGFELRTTLRCTQIAVTTQPGTTQRVRTYHLDYLDQRGADVTDLPPNRVSLLSRVRVEGHDGEQSESLPPLEFSYTAFEPEQRRYQPFSATADATPDRALGGEYDLVDLFGNGLPSVLHMNGVTRYWRNLGGGHFDEPQLMRTAPAGTPLSSAGVQIADMDGDGRADLLVTDGVRGGYYSLNFDGTWDPRSFVRYRQAPALNLEDPDVRLIDLDGDGVVDALRLGQQLELYYNDPRTGWRLAERRTRRDETLPPVSLSDPRVRLADMSGDGLQDLVLVHNGRVDYWPYQGYGRWGKRVTMTQSPRFADAAYAPLGYDPRRILLGDIDGDGCADLVYVGFDHVTIWINGSGNGWSAPIVVRGTPMMSDRASVRLADMHGTGTAGILWTYDYDAYRDSTYKFLDLTGGVKPYLLNGMDNHLGAQTRVEYTSSTQMYVADQQRRESRWQTTLPFPVQVVRRVETIDAISGSKHTTEFRYHHGYWDGAEREFRGFGRVDQRDTETFEAFNAAGDRAFNAMADATFSPPTETRTWFHLGPVGPEFGDWRELDLSVEFWAEDRQQLARPASVAQLLDTLPRRARRDAVRALRGRVLRTELYGLDGSERESRPYTVTESQYSVTDLPAAAPDEPWRQQIFFPYTVALRTTQWERGDDPSTHIVFSDDYDAYGQSRQQTSVALPRRSARRQPKTGATVGAVLVDETRMLATHTRTAYASPDPAVYIFDREAQRSIFEPAAPPTVSESAPADLARVLAEQIAAAQALHNQFRTLLDPWNPSQPLPAQLKLIGHTLNYYDGAASADPAPAGRAVGQVGPYGALVRSEMLLFGDGDLAAAYGDRRPAYLGGSATLPPGAPAVTPATLGYRRSGAGEQPGYYITTTQQRYDFHDPAATQRRGMVLSTRDALGAITTLTLDAYWLLPTLVRDPVGLETRAVHDYRLFQPLSVTDANGSTTHTRYTPLGLVRKTFVQGQDGAGGTEAKPAIEWSYDLFAYERTRHQPQPQPILVRSRRRVWHASENRGDELIEQYEYSDGFGRLIQTRAQAEDLVFGLTGDDVGLAPEAGTVRGPARGQRAADRVIVSGWKIYDNKGRVVEQYEPLLATGWQYRRSEAQGPHLSFFYDPRGQLVRTRNPDGSEQRIARGVPGNLAAPASYAPTPWERFTYDANDLAPLSADPTTGQPLTERAPASHHFTPTSELVDALGRVLCRIERNGSNPATDWLLTRFQYDGRGNLRAVVDPLGRTTVEQHYDLQKRVVRVVSVDAGNRSSVLDALGNLVEYRDSKGSLTVRQYDALRRLTQLWARNTATAPLTLRERLYYGDGGTASQPPAERLAERALNRLGRLARHYDEAGRLDFARYDLLGNLLEKNRRVIGNSALANGWTADWSAGNSENALDATGYGTSTRYDALGRIVQLTTPADVNNARAVLTPRYNRAGTLERVELDGQPYVTQIAYNARGQRVLIAYGNGVMTRYAYDPRSFVLTRARSERFSASMPDTWTGTGAPLQELSYSYDLIGNLTTIDDRTPGCGVAGSPEGRDRLTRRFGYDPLYRLIQADGRACKDIPAPRPTDDLAVCGSYPYRGSPAIPNQNNAPELTERYTESYSYDLLGNLLTQSYQAASRWNRTYTPEAGTNRLRQVVAGSSPAQSFTYDANGNLRQQNTERQYVWDHADRLVGYLNQVGSAKPTVEAQYLYGADGQRVKKWVKTKGGGGAESTVTIDGVFEHYQWSSTSAGKQNNQIHVLDNRQRIAIVRRGPADPDDVGPAIQYHLADHLGSSSVVIDTSGAWINREEFSPYGETLFGGYARKRYRFTGKERDAESGMYYHGARYYAPWLARWISCDPLGIAAGLNMYAYVRGNPLNRVDPTGLADQTPETNLVCGPYKDTGGHHPVQGAAYSKGVGIPDPFYQEAMSISQTKGSFTPEIHKDVNAGQRTINQAAWSSVTGEDVNVTVGKGKLQVQSMSVEATRTNLSAEALKTQNVSLGRGAQRVTGFTGQGTLAPTPTPWFEETKGYYSLSHATGEVEPKVAAQVVSAASNERTAAGSTPQRVPNAPAGTTNTPSNGIVSRISGALGRIGTTFSMATSAVSAWRMSKDHEENGFVNVGGMPVITDPSKIRNGTPVFVFETGRVMYMVNGELAVTPYGNIL